MCAVGRGNGNRRIVTYLPMKAMAEAVRPKRVAAYCRVSTMHEEQTGSLEVQVECYAKQISDNPHWISAGIFVDKKTGRNINGRTGYKPLMQMCREGKVDLILVKSVSRYGRDTLEILMSLQELKLLHVDVYFEIEKLWLHDPKAELLLTVLASVVQYESEDKSSNIRWGIQNGFRTGESPIGNRKCYGYRRDEKGELAIEPFEAAVVRLIYTLHNQGCSLGTISKELYTLEIQSPSGKERWNRETIRYVLNNEKYTGQVMLQKTFVADFLSGKQQKNRGEKERHFVRQHHEAIIDIENRHEGS